MGAWMIRAGRGGAYAAGWLARGVIGISWDFGGADIATMDREEIRVAYANGHPSESKAKVAASVGQVYRFARSMVPGETVVMYNPTERLYHIGTVEGPCTPATGTDAVAYTRAVKWNKAAPRDALTPASKKLPRRDSDHLRRVRRGNGRPQIGLIAKVGHGAKSGKR